MEKEKEDISTELMTKSIKEFEPFDPFNEPIEMESESESESESKSDSELESESSEETKSIKKPKSLEDMDEKDKKSKKYMIDGKHVKRKKGTLYFYDPPCVTCVFGVEYKRTTRKD